MKKRYFLIPVGLVAILLIFAVIVRLSYTDSQNTIGRYQIDCINDDFGNGVKNVDEEAKQMLEKSDLIVKAHFTGKRIITHSAFYSTVKVDKVLKGNKSLVGNDICFINLISIPTRDKYIQTSTILPLYKNNTYMMMLKKVKFSTKRHVKDWQKNQYYAVNNSAESVLRISDQRQTEIFGNGDLKNGQLKYTVDSVKMLEMPAKDKKQLDLYYNIKTSILQKLNFDFKAGTVVKTKN